jgi:hypothetical protein
MSRQGDTNLQGCTLSASITSLSLASVGAIAMAAMAMAKRAPAPYKPSRLIIDSQAASSPQLILLQQRLSFQNVTLADA